MLETASVDACISDWPYGDRLTACDYDKQALDLALLWRELNRVVKPGGAIITTAVQPFTTRLIMSNFDNFRYDLVYRKKRKTGWYLARRRPLAEHESILVFSNGPTAPAAGDKNPAPLPTAVYNPQKLPGKPYGLGTSGKPKAQREKNHIYRNKAGNDVQVANESGDRHPGTVLEFSIGAKERGLHPSQKPQALYEWLIRTYTNPGGLILDPFAGSGTTGAAALATGRKFIVIENDPDYYEIARRRLGLGLSEPGQEQHERNQGAA